MRRAVNRQAVQRQAQNQYQKATIEAPTRGLVLIDNLVSSGRAGAFVLDNWVVTQQSIRPRGGSRKYATIGSTEVLSLWTHTASAGEQFFASDATSIYNISIVADANVAPAPVLTGRTSGVYSNVPVETVGGSFTLLFNGTDTAQVYDGTTFADTAWTGVDTALLSFGWTFANRVFAIQKGTNTVWYLPVDSINGAANEFSLGGVFSGSGELAFGATWSLDSGDGLDDKCVFVSTDGQVAIYEGTNPGDANNWRLVGVYEITPPMGNKGTMRAGGDLLIATEDGLVPVSEAIRKDVAALSLSAVSRNIEPLWRELADNRGTSSWEVLKWPNKNMMIVSTPDSQATPGTYSLVANLETGAWSRFVGMDIRVMSLFNDGGYFGTAAGTILQMEVGGSDDGTNYVSTYIGLPDHLGSIGDIKTVHSARSIFRARSPYNARVTVGIDYDDNITTAPPDPIPDFVSNNWDEGQWDQLIWDAGELINVNRQWVSIGRSGVVVLPQVQINNMVTPLPDLEYVAFDLVYETGGIMV